MLKGYKIKVTALDLLTGRATHHHVLSSDADVSSPASIAYVGANIASPVIVWSDKSRKTLKINTIGSKRVHSIPINNDSGEEVQSIKVEAPQRINSLSHFLVYYETTSSSWADVFHIDLKAGTLSRAFQLPRVQGVSVFATSGRDANVYLTRIAESEISVVSTTSHELLGKWDLNPSLADRPLQAVSEVVLKGNTAAVRAAVLLASGDWQLIRNGHVEWTRHEALAGVVAASWVEADDDRELVHELVLEGHETLLGAYVHRVKRHLRDLQHLPDWLSGLPKRIVSGLINDQVSDLKSFGIDKSVVAATEGGRVFAIAFGQHGSVTWNVKAVDTDKWNVKAITARAGAATVYADDGSSVTLNTTSGGIIAREAPSASVHSIAIIDRGSYPVGIGINEDGAPIKPLEVPDFLVTSSIDGRIIGRKGGDPIWEFLPPHDQKIIHAIARPPHDPVASIGKVLGDRSVLYKYLNRNLALITAAGETTATFYLLDAISGKVLYTSTHSGVDTSQPITSTISENWFAYSFWGDVTDTSDAKGYQLVISELYESMIPNDRGPLGSAANYSSIYGVDAPPDPYVISQSYIITEPISYMAVTQTMQGITTRQLLCVLPESNAIIGIPRAILDPRRPVGRDPGAAEVEEGLFKYSPVLEFDGRWFITHSREVAGIKKVISEPTLLESTSVIFAFGQDVFGTRVAPSQAFDILGKGFSKLQLLFTVIALGIGVLILTPMVSLRFDGDHISLTNCYHFVNCRFRENKSIHCGGHSMEEIGKKKKKKEGGRERK